MRRVLLTIFALSLAIFFGTAWYLYDRGFTRKWRTAVMEEFRKRGVEVYFRKLSLDPVRGLVASGVKVLDVRNRRRVLAEIDEMNAHRTEAFGGPSPAGGVPAEDDSGRDTPTTEGHDGQSGGGHG